MREKHLFAGNNTSKGFFSYFDNLINKEEANRIYILKGGPGVGKSSFMKKFGSAMLKKGYSLEHIHCSSDDDSLDGILIPKLKVLLVDGTAPHTIDPVIPGAVDEIINLGVFLDKTKLSNQKEQIIEINKRKSLFYKSAYRYLESANLILEEMQSIYDEVTDSQKYSVLCEEVLNTFSSLQPASNHDCTGKIRKLFSEAYTSSGYITHTDTLCQDRKVWAIVGENTNYSSKLLDSIVVESLKEGLNVESFYTPLNPNKLQHVLIPELNLMIISTKEQLDNKYDKIINLHGLMKEELLKTYNPEITSNQILYDKLINNALEKLGETKKQHESLEAIYKQCMNFEGVDKCFEEVLSNFI